MAHMMDWVPVATLVLGSALALSSGLVTETFRERRASKKDVETRERDRAAQGRIDDIQLLSDLQDAMVGFYREAYLLLDQAMKNQSWPAGLPAPVLIEGLQLSSLRVRVPDDELRGLVNKLEDAVVDTLNATNLAQAVSLRDAMGLMSDRVNERIGEMLRRLRLSEDVRLVSPMSSPKFGAG
jgi:hypothetical protein